MLLPQQVIWWQILLPISIEISHCRSDSKARKGGMGKQEKESSVDPEARLRAGLARVPVFLQCTGLAGARLRRDNTLLAVTRCSSLRLPVQTRCLLLEVRFCARKHIHLHAHEYGLIGRLHYCSDVGAEGQNDFDDPSPLSCLLLSQWCSLPVVYSCCSLCCPLSPQEWKAGNVSFICSKD